MFRLFVIVIILFFIDSFSVLFAQVDSIITYHTNGQIESIIPLYNGVREGEAKFFDKEGMLIEEVSYLNGRVDGLVKKYNNLGFLQETFNIEDGKREGPTSLFDSAGVYIGDKDYLNGRLILKIDEPIIYENEKVYVENTPPVSESKTVKKNNSSNKQTTTASLPHENSYDNLEDDPAYFIRVEVAPEPVGGLEGIRNRLYYPEEAKKRKIQGTVKIRAYIDRFGDVEKTEIVEGIGYGCEEAAEITVNYTKFTPGLIKGKPVKVQLIIPVVFKLD